MIISNAKDGTTLIAGTPLELVQEATNIIGGLIEKIPEILLTVLSTYDEEIIHLDPDEYKTKMAILTVIAEMSKKSLKESKRYGD